MSTGYRVHYQHDNPGYVHPVTKQLIAPEGLVEDADEFLAADANEAEEQSAQAHWNDQEFQILRTEEFEVPNA